MITSLFKRATGALLIWVAATAFLYERAMATAGWSHFVQQQCNPNDPTAHGLGDLLSASQQQQLAALDDAVSQVEDQLSQAIGAGQIAQDKVTEIRQLLGTIQQKQTDILTRGQLDYEAAEGLLL